MAETITTSEAHLDRRLSLLSVVAFGLSYMAPALVMVIFGIIAVASDGTAASAFLMATGAMLLTALSYAKMARIYPGLRIGVLLCPARPRFSSRIPDRLEHSAGLPVPADGRLAHPVDSPSTASSTR